MLGAFPKSYGIGFTVNAAKYANQCLKPSVFVKQEDINNALFAVTTPPQPHTGRKLPDLLLQKQLGSPAAAAQVNGTTQYRMYHHNDIAVPKEFDKFRVRSARDPYKSQRDGEDDGIIHRKTFQYMMYAGMALPGAVVAKTYMTNFGRSFYTIGKDIVAASKTEVDLDSIPEGKTVLLTWRSKPLFIRHRTAEEIETEAAVKTDELRHSETDAERCKNPEWLIVIGVCTHLGCVPVPEAGQFGGFFCPCHGSHYDTSGRIRKGPAPLNLECPPYNFTDENTVVVG